MKLRYNLLLVMLLMYLALLGCQKQVSTPVKTVTDPLSQLTEAQVVSAVHVYGVPNFGIDNVQGNPVGPWSAVYEGEQGWRIQGAVVVQYDYKDYYFSTTWRYSANELRLVDYSGELPKAPISMPTTSYRRPLDIKWIR